MDLLSLNIQIIVWINARNRTKQNWMRRWTSQTFYFQRKASSKTESIISWVFCSPVNSTTDSSHLHSSQPRLFKSNILIVYNLEIQQRVQIFSSAQYSLFSGTQDPICAAFRESESWSGLAVCFPNIHFIEAAMKLNMVWI